MATDVIAAVEALVAGYGPGATPDTGQSATGEGLSEAVASAERAMVRLGCDREAFNTTVQEGLAGIAPEGAVATAVWRRVSASLLGEVENEPAERALAEGESLADALATAAPGSTILLPAGTTVLTESVVLLEAVTIRGEGRDGSTLSSTAPQAAFLVATDGLVEFADLTLELEGDADSSGIVTGPSASLVLTGLRVTGANRGDGGAGGAGVQMSAEGEEGSGRGTTLEVSDCELTGNEWAGLVVAGGHRVSVVSATFSANGEVGALFLDAASGSIADSTFTDNGVGVAGTGRATPTLLRSTIAGGNIGLQLEGETVATVDDLRISRTASAAVVYGGTATGAARALTCSDTPFGTVISDTAAPTISGNDCQVHRGS